MKKTKWISLALASIAIPAAVMAADHIEGPATSGDPSIDITDLYAWTTSDAEKVNLVLNVTPFAEDTSSFSDSAQYVFHVNSSAGYGMDQTETLIICEFASGGDISCWAGDDEYVTGDASAEAGISSETGDLKVFAGLRNDPFFMELTGFNNAVAAAVAAVEGGLGADDEGCPDVDEPTRDVLLGHLTNSGAPVDTLGGANVLSIVVQVDKDVVNAGGPILGVWASTHNK